jgi:hypothetical protein
MLTNCNLNNGKLRKVRKVSDMENKYKISKVLSKKMERIDELESEIYELTKEIGIAQVLAWVSIAINNNVPYESIRKEIDNAVGKLSLEAIELYTEIKAGMGGK